MRTTLLPGNHIVKVTVANGLGNMSAALSVSVLYPITIQHIAARTVTLGRPLLLEAVLSGDLDFILEVNFEDGKSIAVSTAEPNHDLIFTPVSNSSGNESAPTYLLKLQHLYTTPGSYLVSLSVANEVSCVTSSLTAAVVDKEDLDVVLMASHQSPISSDSFVTFTASAAVLHDDVRFSWICGQCVGKPLVHR